ncbi:MAG: hypothetical protein ACOCWL_03420, partial [Thermoguttaceae bacterium]
MVTAKPGGLGIIDPVTAVPSTPIPQPAAPTATSTPFTPTPLPPEQVPGIVSAPPTAVFIPDFTTANTEAFRFNIAPGNFSFGDQVIPGSVSLFAPNPADAASYARTDATGLLYVRGIGTGGESTLATDPFFAGFGVPSPDENKNLVTDMAWSPDGRRLAFLIQPP